MASSTRRFLTSGIVSRPPSDDDDNLDNDKLILHRCITEDDLETFTSLINDANCTYAFLAQCDENGDTPLHLVVRANKAAFIQVILQAKAYSAKLLEIKNRQNETAWQLALDAGTEEAFCRRNKEEVEEVLEATRTNLLPLDDTNPELKLAIDQTTNMINAAEAAINDLEMITPATVSELTDPIKRTFEVITSDPADNAEILKRYQQELARQQATTRSWSRVFAYSMATILCLSLLAVAVCVSLVAVGIPIPFVAAGLGLLGLTLGENAIVASIGFGLIAPTLLGFSGLFGMHAVKSVPTKNDNIILSGMKP